MVVKNADYLIQIGVQQMKKLKFKKSKHNYHEDQKENIDRIVSVCFQRGYLISGQDAMVAWERYSDMFAAGWLCLPKEDDHLFNDIMTIMEEEK